MAKVIKLSGTQNGVITITKLIAPYGEGSENVASIGISLAGNTEEPEWKVHIPLDNIDEVVEALQAIK